MLQYQLSQLFEALPGKALVIDADLRPVGQVLHHLALVWDAGEAHQCLDQMPGESHHAAAGQKSLRF